MSKPDAWQMKELKAVRSYGPVVKHLGEDAAAAVGFLIQEISTAH